MFTKELYEVFGYLTFGDLMKSGEAIDWNDPNAYNESQRLNKDLKQFVQAGFDERQAGLTVKEVRYVRQGDELSLTGTLTYGRMSNLKFAWRFDLDPGKELANKRVFPKQLFNSDYQMLPDDRELAIYFPHDYPAYLEGYGPQGIRLFDIDELFGLRIDQRVITLHVPMCGQRSLG